MDRGPARPFDRSGEWKLRSGYRLDAATRSAALEERIDLVGPRRRSGVLVGEPDAMTDDGGHGAREEHPREDDE
jgi:hypothetical protein